MLSCFSCVITCTSAIFSRHQNTENIPNFFPQNILVKVILPRRKNDCVNNCWESTNFPRQNISRNFSWLFAFCLNFPRPSPKSTTYPGFPEKVETSILIGKQSNRRLFKSNGLWYFLQKMEAKWAKQTRLRTELLVLDLHQLRVELLAGIERAAETATRVVSRWALSEGAWHHRAAGRTSMLLLLLLTRLFNPVRLLQWQQRQLSPRISFIHIISTISAGCSRLVVSKSDFHGFGNQLHLTVGNVAKWLGHRSLAGGRFLNYAWSMVGMWPLRG